MTERRRVSLFFERCKNFDDFKTSRMVNAMKSTSRLRAAFEAYLRAECDTAFAAPLVAALLDCESTQEALALRGFVQRQSSFTVCDGAWEGSECSLEWHPPSAPRPGELWFDARELTLMAYVTEFPGWSSDLRGWMAIRPVQKWQYAAFLAIAQPPSGTYGDRFDRDRLTSDESIGPIVDLYADEAKAYASFFRKRCVGGGHLICAEPFLTLARKEQLSPEELLLWDPAQPSSHLFYAVGFARDSGAFVEVDYLDSDRDSCVGFATLGELTWPMRESM
jgi:hypothetical protein